MDISDKGRALQIRGMFAELEQKAPGLWVNLNWAQVAALIIRLRIHSDWPAPRNDMDETAHLLREGLIQAVAHHHPELARILRNVETLPETT